MQKFETVLCPELGNVHQIDEYYGTFSEALQNIRMYGLTDKYGEKSLAQRFYNGLPALLKQWRPFTDALVQLSKAKALLAATPQKHVPHPPSNAGRGPPFNSMILTAGDTKQFAPGGEDLKAEAWVQNNASKFDVKFGKVRQGAFLIIGSKPNAITRFLNASKQVGIVATQLPERSRDEKRPSPGSGERANVAKQDISHILAMQQHAPLPLADSSVLVAHSRPDVIIANVANLIDMPGAHNAQQLPSTQVPITSNARSTSFSYFANRGPANQVGGQVRLQPTGLVAIEHRTNDASNKQIEEEEPERQELCSTYDVNVRDSYDKIEEEEPERQELCSAHDVNVIASHDDSEEDEPERQELCSAYDVDLCTSDVFACVLRRRIRDRCAAKTIQLANDDDLIAALQFRISELELDLYESHKQVKGLVYATYDQIWEAKETRKIDKINL